MPYSVPVVEIIGVHFETGQLRAGNFMLPAIASAFLTFFLTTTFLLMAMTGMDVIVRFLYIIF
ncbi:hypothetical protein EAJ11_12545 [Bacteroides uniformis]|nr:hypothetical protein EAJ11_12545 [Bacteroides uniformis]